MFVRSAAGLCSLGCAGTGACLFTFIFVMNGIMLPRLYRLIRLNKPTVLPVCFFALVNTCGCKFGIKVLATILSPLIGDFLFKVPSIAVLPTVLMGSMLLTLITKCVTSHFHGVAVPTLLKAIVTCRIINALVR